MQMRSSAAATIADIANDIAAMNVLAGKHSKAFHMPIAGGDSVAVIDYNGTSVAAHEVGELHYSIRRRQNFLAVNRADINA
jgi:hypothetical protein